MYRGTRLHTLAQEIFVPENILVLGLKKKSSAGRRNSLSFCVLMTPFGSPLSEQSTCALGCFALRQKSIKCTYQDTLIVFAPLLVRLGARFYF